MANILSCTCYTIVLGFVIGITGCAKQHIIEVSGSQLSLSYRNAEAKEVFFVSSVDNFQHHATTRKTRDIWQITLPLRNEFVYFYIVDGKVTIPDCPDTILDDFGGKNCIYQHTM